MHAPNSILVVDDDDIDAQAVTRALKKQGMSNPIGRARDGIEALEILRQTGGHDSDGRPYTIVLDLNMPRMNGLEFLSEMRSDPDLSDMVVFVLTTSSAPEDRAAATGHRTAGYVVKSDLRGSYETLACLLDTYARVVSLPY